jgi:hypothetical protein
MKLQKIILISIAAILLLETKVFCQSDNSMPDPATESAEDKASNQILDAFRTNLATNAPLSKKDFTNQVAAVDAAYHHGKIDKGVAIGEIWMLTDNQAQDFYGKVIDQNGKPVAGADVTANIGLIIGAGSTHKTQTDAEGLFQFIGLRGKSLDITLEKKKFQIEGPGLGLKWPNSPDTNPNDRAVYTVSKLKESDQTK